MLLAVLYERVLMFVKPSFQLSLSSGPPDRPGPSSRPTVQAGSVLREPISDISL